MEEKEVMAFKDEDGNKVELEIVAKIYLDELEYLILSPTDGNEDDAFVFRVDEEDGKVVYNMVEDDKEFIEVKKEYSKLLYGE
ncbi:DUF1292 domain-containing protein [Clostridium sp. 19966]|uniref:DUF1292 domain-containing protein n=1 Tax=Clostridium sp. 19966 TaxID=2768166 RepID=UPI0028DF7B21|nr:DUF1292 domain-containing protein [Clostridium sp. 19966]MDT8715218.1 DUF1292 domain-containing protein [Clostridium sp. 19966]